MKSHKDPLDSQYRELKTEFLGAYAGFVEDVTDPLNIGRVRVRVPNVYGDEQSTPTDIIPWAMPCFQAFSFTAPDVGDAVWVIFQEGSSEHPVYLGWFPSKPEDEQYRGRHPKRESLKYDPVCRTTPRPIDQTEINALRNYVARAEGVDPDSVGLADTVELRRRAADAVLKSSGNNIETFVTPPGTEVVPEALTRTSPDPVIKVLFKSPKGHTILYSDDPGCEYLKIIDRAGQEIVMDCPIEFEWDKNNKTARGTLEAEKNGQIPLEKIRTRVCRIQITDRMKQVIQMWAEEREGPIDRSRMLMRTSEGHFIELNSGHNAHEDETSPKILGITAKPTPVAEEHRIHLKTAKGHHVTLDDKNDEIVVEHFNGSIIHMKENGDISIKNSSGNHEILMDSSHIIVDNDSVHKRLVWLEAMFAKFNTHTHLYNPGPGGPIPTATPIPQFNDTDGTTHTLAG